MTTLKPVAGCKKRARQSGIPIKELPHLKKHWRNDFLFFLAESSNVRLACERAEVPPSTAYDLRRRDGDFAAKWAEALAEGYDNLEMELLHRLRTGGTAGDPKFDHGVAFRVLQQHRENVMREKARRANVDAATVRASIARKVAELRAFVLAEQMLGLHPPALPAALPKSLHDVSDDHGDR